MRTRNLVSLAVAAGLVLGAAPNGPGDPNGNALGHVYGDEARAQYCSWAQQAVAGTDLVSENVLHDDATSFMESDAAPYDTDEGRTLPLTTHQFLSTIEHPTAGPIEAVLSCKLKGGQAVQQHFGPTQGQLGRFCTDAHADLADRVFGALKDKERKALVYDRDDIVLDPDVPAAGGGDWTSGQPQGGEFAPPKVAFGMPDGKLHLRSKALIVPAVGVDIPPFVGRNKQGTHYCHLIAPTHLRDLVTGVVAP